MNMKQVKGDLGRDIPQQLDWNGIKYKSKREVYVSTQTTGREKRLDFI